MKKYRKKKEMMARSREGRKGQMDKETIDGMKNEKQTGVGGLEMEERMARSREERR